MSRFFNSIENFAPWVVGAAVVVVDATARVVVVDLTRVVVVDATAREVVVVLSTAEVVEVEDVDSTTIWEVVDA